MNKEIEETRIAKKFQETLREIIPIMPADTKTLIFLYDEKSKLSTVFGNMTYAETQSVSQGLALYRATEAKHEGIEIEETWKTDG